MWRVQPPTVSDATGLGGLTGFPNTPSPAPTGKILRRFWDYGKMSRGVFHRAIFLRDRGSSLNAAYLRGVTKTQTFNGSATGWRGTQTSIRVPSPGLE